MSESMEAAMARMETKIEDLTRRMDSLEKLTDSVNKLALSCEKLSSKLESTDEQLGIISGKVSSIEQRPGKRWDMVIAALISGLIGAIIGHIA